MFVAGYSVGIRITLRICGSIISWRATQGKSMMNMVACVFHHLTQIASLFLSLFLSPSF